MCKGGGGGYSRTGVTGILGVHVGGAVCNDGNHCVTSYYVRNTPHTRDTNVTQPAPTTKGLHNITRFLSIRMGTGHPLLYWVSIPNRQTDRHNHMSVGNVNKHRDQQTYMRVLNVNRQTYIHR